MTSLKDQFGEVGKNAPTENRERLYVPHTIIYTSVKLLQKFKSKMRKGNFQAIIFWCGVMLLTLLPV